MLDGVYLHTEGEAVAVGRALGAKLLENYAEDRMKFADSLPATMDSSLHHDLRHGNKLEVEWLAGGWCN